MTISVVIPVYNTSSFLKECLDSIINQTYDNLEIICVNDGSTDNSLEILEEYKSKDKRIKVINQQNKGLSGARNSGIKEATGEYIAFIDSDDWVDLNFFEKLYDSITKNDADIAAATILRTREHSKKVRVKYDKEEVFLELKDKIKACSIPKCCYVWNKLYKTAIVKNFLFREGIYYEDILWTPNVLKNSSKLSTAVGTNYYYRANSASIVKKKQTPKKQYDSYNAKKFIVNFFKSNNLELSKKEKTITKRLYHLSNFVIFKVKEYENTETYNFLGFLPVFRKKIKTPVIKDNTFIVCELCSSSHSEVVPGYVKYLLDLGYHVSVLVHPDRYKEGLFSRFKDDNVTLNKMSRKEIKEYFKNDSMEDVKGVLITTVGKICDCIHYEKAYNAFSPNIDRKKLFFVEHEASFASDKGSWKEDLITLRKLNYNNEKSVVVNPHYFGEIKTNPKNSITNFITVGAIKPNKKNSQMIVDACYKLVQKGYTNFKITVVGKGNLKHIPKEARKFFDIKGRLPFKKMYDEIERADFFLMSYNEYDPEHIRYNTSGTSGNFQLIYGFLKPCILTEGFAPINGMDETNAVLYKGDENYSNAMIKAIEMSNDDYAKMRESLKTLAQNIYNQSKENLQNLINKGADYES